MDNSGGRPGKGPYSILAAAVLAPALTLPAGSAPAMEVSVAGIFGNKAVMVIDGGRPRTVGVGANTPEGVKLVAVDAGGAVVEMEGRRRRLALGVPVVSGEEAARRGDSVALPPDSRGHFVTSGRVNGAAVQFLVDTGATFVSLGAADADRAGIDYRRGEPATTMTANGRAQVWRVRLASVRVGDVTLNDVEAAVHSGDLPVALLGMSFLNRMEMRHEGSALVLRKRY